MLRLLASALACGAAPVRDRQALDRAMVEVRQNITQSRRVLDEISAMLAQMAQQGHQETAEYRRIFAAYQGLSRLVADASRELKTREDAEARSRRAEEPGGHDFSGVTPIKATLGPAGRAGVVSKGPEITNLQRFLAATGIVVTETGDFDTRTRAAVQQFQTKHGLTADGTVGASVRKLINDMLKGG